MIDATVDAPIARKMFKVNFLWWFSSEIIYGPWDGRIYPNDTLHMTKIAAAIKIIYFLIRSS